MIEGTVEVEGTVEIKNAAQSKNLLQLAKTAYESKNYEQAEKFCDQIIAMDSNNYDAWKVKGDSIFWQIKSDDINPRILEYYNCIITSYHVLPDDEEKSKTATNILCDLADNLIKYVKFMVGRVEEERPTESSVTKAKNAYTSSYNILKNALDEMQIFSSNEYEQILYEQYLNEFANKFISNCIETCKSAWKTTVGYNYYRDIFNRDLMKYVEKGENPFDGYTTSFNTDVYHPMEKTFDTFRSEIDKLESLLDFAWDQNNIDTPDQSIHEIYDLLILLYKHELVCKSYKIKYSSLYKKLMWYSEYTLTDESKSAIQKCINLCGGRLNIQKLKHAEKIMRDEMKRKALIELYWETHSEESKKLTSELEQLNSQIEPLASQIKEIDDKNADQLNSLIAERDKKLSCEIDVDNQKSLIKDLEAQRDKCGFFKGKERKALEERINQQEQPKLYELQKKANIEKKKHTDTLNIQIDELKNDGKELRDELEKLQKRVDEIKDIYNNTPFQDDPK